MKTAITTASGTQKKMLQDTLALNLMCIGRLPASLIISTFSLVSTDDLTARIAAAKIGGPNGTPTADYVSLQQQLVQSAFNNGALNGATILAQMS